MLLRLHQALNGLCLSLSFFPTDYTNPLPDEYGLVDRWFPNTKLFSKLSKDERQKLKHCLRGILYLLRRSFLKQLQDIRDVLTSQTPDFIWTGRVWEISDDQSDPSLPLYEIVTINKKIDWLQYAGKKM